MTTSSSITIQKELDSVGGREIGRSGEGDATLILWKLNDGRMVIETNGDPIWDCHMDFHLLLNEIEK